MGISDAIFCSVNMGQQWSGFFSLWGICQTKEPKLRAFPTKNVDFINLSQDWNLACTLNVKVLV